MTKWNKGKALCLLSVFGLAGCFGYRTGQKFEDSSVKNIRTGKSTKADVLRMFGQPPARNSLGGGKETWTYQYQEVKSHATAANYIPVVGLFAGGAKSKMNQQTLTVEFSGDVVAGCRYAKSSSNSTMNMGVLGVSSNPGQSNDVSTPCEEAE